MEASSNAFVLEGEDSISNNRPHAICCTWCDWDCWWCWWLKKLLFTTKITRNEIHLATSTKDINTQNECKYDDKILTAIYPSDNSPKVFEKVIDFDEFPQHLKIYSEKYASQIGVKFVISLDELRALVAINFAVGYHKLPNLKSYWGSRNSSASEKHAANVIPKKHFRKLLSIFSFLAS